MPERNQTINEPIKGFKGFDKDLKCREFQYEVGKEYQTDEKPIICEQGFHFCENPLDVLNYYDLCESEFCEVESLPGAQTDKAKDDTKISTTKIKIKASIGLKGFVCAAIDFLLKITKENNKSGNSSQLAASGYYSKLAASGDSSQLAASGDSSKLAASGDSSQLAASGNYSRLAASGNSSQLILNGKNSVGAALGPNSKIKGEIGCWITLAEWKEDKPVCVKSVKINGKKIKADTFYELKNGKLVEVAL